MEAINSTARDLIENGGFIGGEFPSRSARSITFEVLSFSKSVGLICNNEDQVFIDLVDCIVVTSNFFQINIFIRIRDQTIICWNFFVL